MKRSGMSRVYVGDVGFIVEPTIPTPIPPIDTSNLTLRELGNLALNIGIDIRDIIGILTCEEHIDMVFLGDKEMPEGYNLIEHCVYCKNCWQLFSLSA